MRAGFRGGERILRFIRSLSASLELPQDALLDIPRVVLVGGVQAHIGNHKGVVEYTPARVRVLCRDGLLTVEGKGLRIGSIFRDELVVEGQIERIDLGRGERPREEPGR